MAGRMTGPTPPSGEQEKRLPAIDTRTSGKRTPAARQTDSSAADEVVGSPPPLQLDLDLQELARRYLWMQWTHMPDYLDGRRRVPIYGRGEDCYVYDDEGRRYLDALSWLLCLNLVSRATANRSSDGRPGSRARIRPELVDNASCRRPTGSTHGELVPGDLNRSVLHLRAGLRPSNRPSSWLWQFHKLTGHPTKTKVIARQGAYHGTTPVRSSATGSGPRASHSSHSSLAAVMCRLRTLTAHHAVRPMRTSPKRWRRGSVRGTGDGRGRHHGAGPELGWAPDAAAGYFQRVRDICDENDVLLDLSTRSSAPGPAGRPARMRALRRSSGHGAHCKGHHLWVRRRLGGDRNRPRFQPVR